LGRIFLQLLQCYTYFSKDEQYESIRNIGEGSIKSNKHAKVTTNKSVVYKPIFN